MRFIMIASFIAGVVFGLSSGFSPGPFMTLVIAQSLEHGPREGVKVALAPLITDALIILLTVLLLTRLAQFQFMLGILALGGSLFLCHLAYENFRTRAFDLVTETSSPRSLRKGVLVNFLNPNPYLFWLTVGSPRMLEYGKESLCIAAGFLAGFYGCLVGSKVLIAITTGKSRNVLSGKPYVYIMRILGAVLLVFAVMLFRNALEFLGILEA